MYFTCYSLVVNIDSTSQRYRRQLSISNREQACITAEYVLSTDTPWELFESH